MKEIYAPNGNVLQTGDLLVQPKLARTLRRIAEEGAQTFYNGSLAQDILKEINEAGGNWTAADLSGYVVKERPVLRNYFRGFEILGASPPLSGGLVLAQALNTLEYFPLPTDKFDAQFVHRMIEALKFGFNNRMLLVRPFLLSF